MRFVVFESCGSAEPAGYSESGCDREARRGLELHRLATGTAASVVVAAVVVEWREGGRVTSTKVAVVVPMQRFRRFPQNQGCPSC